MEIWYTLPWLPASVDYSSPHSHCELTNIYTELVGMIALFKESVLG